MRRVGIASPSQVWTAARRDLLTLAGYLDDVELRRRGSGMLLISGGPQADFNMCLVDAGDDEAAAFGEFVTRVNELSLPAVFMLSGGCSERLAPMATVAGLFQAATAPLMMLTDTSVQPMSGDFDVQRVTDTNQLEVWPTWSPPVSRLTAPGSAARS